MTQVYFFMRDDTIDTCVAPIIYWSFKIVSKTIQRRCLNLTRLVRHHRNDLEFRKKYLCLLYFLELVENIDSTLKWVTYRTEGER